MRDNHSQEEIKIILLEILWEFVINELELIKMNVNERTLWSSLSCYIKKHSEFVWWDVDCEYNRDGIDNPKRSSAGDKRIIPDIVIHKRGFRWPNYIAIELKKSPVNSNEKKKDLRTLHELKNHYHYKYCIFLEISKEIQKIEFN
jgi:hypothetical protein